MKNIEDFINEAQPADLQITGLNSKTLVDMLKDAFCEEMNAWYQYFIICPFLVGSERTNIQNDYEENCKEELEHAEQLLERINQLGGNYAGIETPDMWNKMASHKYIIPVSVDVAESVQQMIDAEKGAIETYTQIEEFTRNNDIVTNQMVKGILADEQKHLQEMIEFLDDIK